MAASNGNLLGTPAAMHNNLEPLNSRGGIEQPRTPEPSQGERSPNVPASTSIEQITALISLVRQREAGIPLDSTIEDLIDVLHCNTPCSQPDRERVEEISDSLKTAISNRQYTCPCSQLDGEPVEETSNSLKTAISNRQYTCPVCSKSWSGKKARNELVNRHIKSSKDQPIRNNFDMLHHEFYVKYFGMETVCPFCREHLKTLPAFVKHMLQYHEVDPLDDLIPPSEPGVYHLWDKNTLTDILIGSPPRRDVAVPPWQDVMLNNSEK